MDSFLSDYCHLPLCHSSTLLCSPWRWGQVCWALLSQTYLMVSHPLEMPFPLSVDYRWSLAAHFMWDSYFFFKYYCRAVIFFLNTTAVLYTAQELDQTGLCLSVGKGEPVPQRGGLQGSTDVSECRECPCGIIHKTGGGKKNCAKMTWGTSDCLRNEE